MFLRGVGKEKGSNARVTRSKFSWRFLSASLPLPSHPANRYCVVEIKGGREGRGSLESIVREFKVKVSCSKFLSITKSRKILRNIVFTFYY